MNYSTIQTNKAPADDIVLWHGLSHIAICDGSDIDPYGSVIFPQRGSDIIFAFQTERRATSLGEAKYYCEAISLTAGEYN